MGQNLGNSQSNIPLPILEFINVSFIEKDSIEVKFGDLFGSETINVNMATIDFVPSAQHFLALLDVDPTGVADGDVFVYSSVDHKFHPISIDSFIQSVTIYEEVPNQIDVRTFQTVNNYIPNSLKVYLNGLEEIYITKIAPNKFAFEIDTDILDIITCDYTKA
jgi:hypothetical protein